MSSSSVAESVYPRSPGDWLDDLAWHRRMYRQSRFRWTPEDAITLALAYTHGRVEFDTAHHLQLLDGEQLRLRAGLGQVRDVMAGLLRVARSCYAATEWEDVVRLVGLPDDDACVFVGPSVPVEVARNSDVRRVLRGIPLPNPLSQVWELQQLYGLYAAADRLLEDTICDLAVELAPGCGWDRLAALTTDRDRLRWRVDRQRAERGEPGDTRRHEAQGY